MNMNRIRVLIIILVFILIVSSITADATALSINPVNNPWIAQSIDEDKSGVMNTSSAFVGTNQIPMLSYNKDGSYAITFVHKATSAVVGNCGPNDSWFSFNLNDPSIRHGTVSNMAYFQVIDTFLVKWAYQADFMVRGK